MLIYVIESRELSGDRVREFLISLLRSRGMELKFVDSNVFAYYIFKKVVFLSIRRLALERLGLRRFNKLKTYISRYRLDFAIYKLSMLKEVINETRHHGSQGYY